MSKAQSSSGQRTFFGDNDEPNLDNLSGWKLGITLLVLGIIAAIVAALIYLIYKRYKARKRSLNDSLRVEYSVSGDDEVWIPPGPPRNNFKYVALEEMNPSSSTTTSSTSNSYGSLTSVVTSHQIPVPNKAINIKSIDGSLRYLEEKQITSHTMK